MNKASPIFSSWLLLCHPELVSGSILANFAVVSLVCCNRLAGTHVLMACNCEALTTYAVFDFAELVDVDFGWLFAGEVAGKEHSVSQCAG